MRTRDQGQRVAVKSVALALRAAKIGLDLAPLVMVERWIKTAEVTFSYDLSGLIPSVVTVMCWASGLLVVLLELVTSRQATCFKAWLSCGPLLYLTLWLMSAEQHAVFMFLRVITVILVSGAVLGLTLLWRDRRADSRSRGLVTLLAVLAIPIFFSAWWHATWDEPIGDEGHVLLLSYSLLQDGDVDLLNNYRANDSLRFMKARLIPQTNDPQVDGELRSRHSPLLAGFLIPGLLLGGRLGVHLWFAVLLLALAAVIYKITLELTTSIEAAWWTSGMMIVSPPLLLYSGVLFSEIPGALLVAGAFYTALRENQRSRAFVIISGMGLLGYFIKPRFALVIAPMLVVLVLKRIHGRALLLSTIGGVLTLVIGIGYSVALKGTPFTGHSLDDLAKLEPARLGVGILGLAFDQQYGLLFYAPFYGAAALGLGLWVTQRPGRWFAPLTSVAACLPYLTAIGLSAELIGGYCPQPRFIIVLLPLIGPFIGVALHRAQQWPWALLIRTAYLLSLGWLAVMMTFPELKVPIPGMSNPVLAALEPHLSLNLLELFPSFDRPGSDDFLFILGLGLGGLSLGLLVKKLQLVRSPVLSGTGWSTSIILLQLVALLILVFAPGQKLGASEIEDQVWRKSSGSMVWESTHRNLWPYQLWWRLPSGEWVERTASIGVAAATLAVWARCPEATETPPVLLISVNERPAASYPVSSDRWRAYEVKLAARDKPEQISIRLTSAEPETAAIDLDRVVIHQQISGEAKAPEELFQPKYFYPLEVTEEFVPITWSAGAKTQVADVVIHSVTITQLSPTTADRIRVSFDYSRLGENDDVQDSLLKIDLILRERLRKQTIRNLELPTGVHARFEYEFELDPELGSGRLLVGLVPSRLGPEPLRISSTTRFFQNMVVLGSITMLPQRIPKVELGGELVAAVPQIEACPWSTYLAQHDSITLEPQDCPGNQPQALFIESAVFGTMTAFSLDQVIGKLVLTGSAGVKTIPIRIGIETGEREAYFPGVERMLAHPLAPAMRSWTSELWGKTYRAHSYYSLLPVADLEQPTITKLSCLLKEGVWAIYTLGWVYRRSSPESGVQVPRVIETETMTRSGFESASTCGS